MDYLVSEMVNKCSAYGCRSGYRNEPVQQHGEKITFHAYPLKNEELCQKWIKANPRMDFVPTKYSRVCSLHFVSSDFVDQRTDTNASRRKQQSLMSEKPLRQHLKPDAVPSIFQNAPGYLSKPPVSRRPTERATTASRREHQESLLLELEESFIAEDDISSLSLEEIEHKLGTETIPDGYLWKVIDQSLIIYQLEIKDFVATISASLLIKSDLNIVACLNDKIIPTDQYEDLVKGPIREMSQLLNMLARIKNWNSDASQRPLDLSLKLAVGCLKDGLEVLDHRHEKHRKISFLIEQVELISVNKYARHYTPQLMILSYMVLAASAAAFKILTDEKVLSLPSTSTLRKVTRRLDANKGLDNSAYLKLRISKMNEFERAMVLIIDEIYVAKRVEYSAGGVQGLTADGAVASTLLCFMIKSLCSKYKDLVALYPMSTLTAVKLHECYNDVMSLLRKVSVNVVAISVDNATTNRKFFVDCLCNGNLQTHIIDPVTGQPIFLLFDPVHDIKNLYNNFQSRKIFECPTLDRNLPNGCVANFKDIVDLHGLEASMSLRKAHRLSPAVLEPKSIEKTSVKLAVAVFSESTRDALRFYADNEGKTSWSGTAEFLSLVIKLWNVMNVKTRTKGKHKREISMDPVRSSADWKLQFLREFADFLKRWEESKKRGLSRETFLALKQTCLALADCASFLLDRLGFKYVLLGHLQSDAIESRFGWLRQLSGANYFISVRQVMENDKKIRALSLLKFSSLSLAEIDDVIQSEASKSTSDDVLADSLVPSLSEQDLPKASDANIIFYVSGAISRSVVRCTKCEDCREALIDHEQLEPPELDDSLNYSSSTFLDSINRGGLSKPTEYSFMLAVNCWRVFEKIKSSTTFLGVSNQRALFCKVVDRVTANESELLVSDNYCTKGHNLKHMLVQRFFNCVAKNLAKDITNKANEHAEPSKAKKRKISKLTSSITA